MSRGDKRVNKLTIYLIKEGMTDLSSVLKTASNPLSIDGVGDFYYSESRPNRPSWLTHFFGGRLNEDLPLISSSAQGLLIVPMKFKGKERWFALAFGHGRHLLVQDAVEDRFGLKVVLNSADPESLRSIDKTSLGSVPKHSREQMSRAVNASEFGIDIEQDLVSSVTAKSQDTIMGTMPTGRDALSVSVPVDLDNLKEFLEHCYERYTSLDYKKNFGWIDQICEVRDRTRLVELDNAIAEKIANGELDKIWMAVPSLVNWVDVEGFTYSRPKSPELYSDIGLESFLESLGDKPVTAATLHDEPVFMIHESTGASERWPAFLCIYGEIVDGKSTYLLTGGKWYEIARDFVEEVNRHYASFEPSSISFPTYAHDNEAKYNIDAAMQLGAASLDKKNIWHGGGQSQIEFCDILTTSNQLVYVKKYSASSVLSHLFAQGVTGGELFVADPVFREKLNEILPDANKLTDPSDAIDASKYEIVYAIISYSSKPLDIPFFSKVSLKNARRRLAGFGYKVRLQKIVSGVPTKIARKGKAEVALAA